MSGTISRDAFERVRADRDRAATEAAQIAHKAGEFQRDVLNAMRVAWHTPQDNAGVALYRMLLEVCERHGIKPPERGSIPDEEFICGTGGPSWRCEECGREYDTPPTLAGTNGTVACGCGAVNMLRRTSAGHG
jgi:hypothetical protein